MNLKDEGIILSIKKYSENSLIVKILSKNNGIYSGFVRSALKSKKSSSTYQIGNLVEFTWQARNSDNLGSFKIEMIRSFLAFIIQSRIKLKCLTTIIDIIEKNILEKEPHKELFIKFLNLLQNLGDEDNVFLSNYIKLEIELLQILGYGIDLSKCVVTGKKEDLYFVSPKSGQAVSREAGEKYRNKLLKLPHFLTKNNFNSFDKNDLLEGLKLSGYFINKYLYPLNKNIEIQSSRNGLISLAKNINF